MVFYGRLRDALVLQLSYCVWYLSGYLFNVIFINSAVIAGAADDDEEEEEEEADDEDGDDGRITDLNLHAH